MATRLRISVLFFISLIAIFSIQTGASAHVRVISTSPLENSTVDRLPARVIIEFSEPLITIGSKNPNSVTVTSATGASVASAPAQVSGSSISIALNQDVTEIGDFTVNYRTVSGDGHTVSGSFTFKVETQTPVKPSPIATTSLEEREKSGSSPPILGFLGVLALLAIVGWALYRARFAHRK